MTMTNSKQINYIFNKGFNSALKSAINRAKRMWRRIENEAYTHTDIEINKFIISLEELKKE